VNVLQQIPIRHGDAKEACCGLLAYCKLLCLFSLSTFSRIHYLIEIVFILKKSTHESVKYAVGGLSPRNRKFEMSVFP